MGTTSKMLIPYPEATGLVKDGWEDMKDIATQVDAKSGLILLNTTSFSAVASQSINDVFSTNYDNYLIKVTGTTGTTDSVGFRLRVSATDATTNYAYQRLISSGATTTSARATGQGQILIQALDVTNNSAFDIQIYRPFIASATILRVISASGEGGAAVYDVSGAHSTATSYTGFTLFKTVSGDMTGVVSVYGYNK